MKSGYLDGSGFASPVADSPGRGDLLEFARLVRVCPEISLVRDPGLTCGA